MSRILKRSIACIVDVITIPFAFLCGIYMKLIRKIGFSDLPIIKRIIMFIGVFPIIDQYYEPLFHPKRYRVPLSLDRKLPGIDFDTDSQIRLLDQFAYADELRDFPIEEKTDGKGTRQYYYNNPSYKAGDGEILYSMIRYFKPSHIVEIGSGYSTLMALSAIRKNEEEDSSYHCVLECIEPYEMPWLEQTSARIIRKKLEDIDEDFFLTLQKQDMLLIDSSHIIRPQGDVLTEYLQILPSLNPGVIVHVHDIFTPRDYPEEWLIDVVRFWNEQYLLEALLSCSGKFEILLAVNYLKHHYYDLLKEKCPMINPGNEPGAFWIRVK